MNIFDSLTNGCCWWLLQPGSQGEETGQCVRQSGSASKLNGGSWELKWRKSRRNWDWRREGYSGALLLPLAEPTWLTWRPRQPRSQPCPLLLPQKQPQVQPQSKAPSLPRPLIPRPPVQSKRHLGRVSDSAGYLETQHGCNKVVFFFSKTRNQKYAIFII